MRDIKIIERDSVYDVLEDTLLLADSIEIEPGDRVLEVGCGTGYVSIMASIMGGMVEGVDINPDAVELSIANAELNDIDNISFYQSDMFENVSGSFDKILFNPPYLPSEDFNGEMYDKCWDGGKGGREATDRFLDGAIGHLREGGSIFLLQSSLCDPERTIVRLREMGLSISIVGRRKLFFEEILVIRASGTESPDAI